VTRWVALLRAVNVGGTGKLAMADLRGIAAAAGFAGVRTYIASGNLLFDADLSEDAVRQALESPLERHLGKPVRVVLRAADALAAVVAANPFPDAAPNRLTVTFLDTAPPDDTLARVTGRADERIALGAREIFIDYGAAMRDSTLRVPAAAAGTARNLNTVARLAAMTREG